MPAGKMSNYNARNQRPSQQRPSQQPGKRRRVSRSRERDARDARAQAGGAQVENYPGIKPEVLVEIKAHGLCPRYNSSLGICRGANCGFEHKVFFLLEFEQKGGDKREIQTKEEYEEAERKIAVAKQRRLNDKAERDRQAKLKAAALEQERKDSTSDRANRVLFYPIASNPFFY